ncbi:glycoside hydrolase family 16 protein [Laetiporus sulphureus 93-53]|uniref:Glycoside hydrolase family 16 protein n=1 Tax=Laetiporus sulphureus 93-53 TaxID=1314785 RepID=A0A165CY22_9APHY|nr:glycoside hydrolase family 16 protein [Laetiporus sulphureus 93-53]KZT03718.1 glycoside hydrolase family 16 protein [Laetiporus sulphureus 93-53]
MHHLKAFASRLGEKASSTPQGPLAPEPNVQTYWRADFSSLDAVAREWEYETGAHGWGNQELQNYTPPGHNTLVTPAGELVILARARAFRPPEPPPGQYTSARLTSRQTFARARGYVHAVLAVPCAQGVWPAFWAMPFNVKWPDDGEVDIMETWNGKGSNGSCLHWGQYNGADNQKHRVRDTQMPNMDAFHEYGFSWDESGHCVWFIDGRPVMRAQAPKTIRPFAEFQVKLNVAMGGNVTGGRTPADGEYRMTVSSVEMQDRPPGGWETLSHIWSSIPEGNTM